MATKYKDSGIPWIGDIPSDWKICRFKYVTALFNGNSLNDTQKEHYSYSFAEECYPYIATKDIQLDIESVNYDNGIKVPKENCPFLIAPKNSTLLCIEGGSAGKKVGYVYQDVCFVNKLCCFHSKQNNRFVYYYVLSRAFGESFSQNIQGLIGGVSISVIKNFPLLLPPLATQKRIADFLDRKCAEIDELAALQETMIAELKRYKQSVITEAVTKGLDPDVPMKDSGVEWIGEIPSHWEMKAVKYVLQRRNQKNDPIISEERLSLSIGVGITKYADKTTNLDRFKDDFTQYQLAYPDDIVLNSMNMIVGAVGKSAFMGCVSPVYYVMIPKNSIESTYYSYLLNTPRIRDVYHSLGKGIYAIERGDGRVNTCRLKVSFYDFGRIEIPVPPNQEQQQINVFLQRKCAEIDELIAIKQQKIEALKEYKKSVIFEYVTGKKEVL